MINMQNLGSKENLGIKFRNNKRAKLRLKLWFENEWYFCNITEYPEIHIQTITS